MIHLRRVVAVFIFFTAVSCQQLEIPNFKIPSSRGHSSIPNQSNRETTPIATKTSKPKPIVVKKEPLPRIPITGGKMSDNRIIESSGLTGSLRRNDVLWTINDGSPWKLFAIGANGQTIESWNVKNSPKNDWESLSSYYQDGKPCLLIADVGNNYSNRNTISISSYQEPELFSKKHKKESLKKNWTQRFQLEGPAKNIEAVAVDRSNNSILLLSKKAPFLIYELPIKTKSRKLIAKKSGEVNIGKKFKNINPSGFLKQSLLGNRITGFDINTANNEAAILTYSKVLLYKKRNNESWAKALQRTPRNMAIKNLYQPEGIAYNLDSTLFATSEGSNAPLQIIRN